MEGTGCADGHGLCPNEPLLRWEMAVWLVRILDDGVEPPAVSQSRFTDVDADQWWAAHADRLAELGVTRGCATGPLRFCPDQAVTRGQMAAFLVRAFQLASAPWTGFVDVDPAGSFADDIDALASARVTAGCATEPRRYCPERDVIRGEMATFLARAAGLVALPDTPVESPVSGMGFLSLAGGTQHTCGLREDLTIRCWGRNDHGQSDAPEGKFIAVVAAGNHSCGLHSDGAIQCWGSNQYGQADAPDGQFTGVDVGWHHSCGVRADGTIECWGYNEAGGVHSGQIDAPEGQFTAVAVGGWHTCGLRNDGSVECWGHNGLGQTEAPQGQFTAVASGPRHSCAIGPDGAVECWGSDRNGQANAPEGEFNALVLGTWHSCGVRTDGAIQCWGNVLPVRNLHDLPGEFTSITAGTFHACGLLADGTVQCWGDNQYGQASPPGTQFAAVAVGRLHACGLLADGTIQCFGSDYHGQTDAPVHRGHRQRRPLLRHRSPMPNNQHGQATPPQGQFTAVGRCARGHRRGRAMQGEQPTRTSHPTPRTVHRRHRRHRPLLRDRNRPQHPMLGKQRTREGHPAPRTVRRRSGRWEPLVRAPNRRHHPMLGEQAIRSGAGPGGRLPGGGLRRPPLVRDRNRQHPPMLGTGLLDPRCPRRKVPRHRPARRQYLWAPPGRFHPMLG